MADTKSFILDMVIADVEGQLANAEKAHQSSIDVSKGHKGAMGSRYDTFLEEAHHLASGYGVQILELGKTLSALRSFRDAPPSVTRGSGYSIVAVENISNGLVTKYFLLPVGGGSVYEVEGEEIVVISLRAPIARALIDVIVGDEVEIRIQEVVRVFRVISVT